MCNVEEGDISAMDLSTDHKPLLQSERERIEKSGGDIGPKEGTLGPLRVWRKDEETPGLAVTRTFGDLVGKFNDLNFYRTQHWSYQRARC